jgi:membrane protein implicated in regulation of membrane protease activity
MEWILDHPVLVWLGLALVLAAVEVITTDLVFLMFSGGALAACAAAALGLPFPAQVICGVLVAVVLLGLLRPRLLRSLHIGGAATTGTAALVGQQALVLEPVDAVTGRIKLAGEVWSARLATDSSTPAAVGQHVRVTQINGATATVVSSADKEQ